MDFFQLFSLFLRAENPMWNMLLQDRLGPLLIQYGLGGVTEVFG